MALGLYQDFGTPREHVPCADGSENCLAPLVDWVEGVAILIAVIIVVVVGSVNDWQKERQFKVLNAKKEDRSVTIIRNGVESMINVKVRSRFIHSIRLLELNTWVLQDVVVGDICLLEPGEIAPVDGIFIRGHNVRCDESGATGESDAMKKATFEECWTEHLAMAQARERGEKVGSPKKDPFIISGSKIMEGVGAYVVVAVGERSFNGRIMMGNYLFVFLERRTLDTNALFAQVFVTIRPTRLSRPNSMLSPNSLLNWAVLPVSSSSLPS